MASDIQISLEMYRYKELVFGKCRFLNESLRGTGILAQNPHFSVISDTEPAIVSGSELHVQGSNDGADNNKFFYDFPSESDAKFFCISVKDLLAEINGQNIPNQVLVKEL